MFEVYIEENSHYADDEGGRLKIGEFADCDEALKICRKIVDEFLAANYAEGMPAVELFQIYKMFGEDAFIVSLAPSENFSAWHYAEKRCREICGDDPVEAE